MLEASVTFVSKAGARFGVGKGAFRWIFASRKSPYYAQTELGWLTDRQPLLRTPAAVMLCCRHGRARSGLGSLVPIRMDPVSHLDRRPRFIALPRPVKPGREENRLGRALAPTRVLPMTAVGQRKDTWATLPASALSGRHVSASGQADKAPRQTDSQRALSAADSNVEAT